MFGRTTIDGFVEWIKTQTWLYPDRVTLVELAGRGHIMMRERPDLVAEAITAFVNKLGN